jgi:hypothetical protein
VRHHAPPWRLESPRDWPPLPGAPSPQDVVVRR